MKMEVTQASQNGRRVCFCLPAAEDGGGWVALAEAMVKLVGMAVKKKQPQSPMGGSSLASVSSGRSFAAVVRERGQRRSQMP